MGLPKAWSDEVKLLPQGKAVAGSKTHRRHYLAPCAFCKCENSAGTLNVFPNCHSVDISFQLLSRTPTIGLKLILSFVNP